MAGNNLIGKMIVTLIKTMEFNGKRKEEFVTFRDELSHISNYVQLLKYHYEDQFEVEYRVDEEVYDLYTFKLLLQPLIENAVFHGIVPKEDTGKIQIDIHRKDDILECSVMDDGVGMEEEQLADIDHGIGFSNVNARLCYYYGAQYRLFVESSPGKGTKVSFCVPVIRSIEGQKSIFFAQNMEGYEDD